MIKKIRHMITFLKQPFSRYSQQPNRAPMKKHHYILGATAIVVGSWITHTTTATVYDDFNNRQAMEFAQAIPNNGRALNGGLPDVYFNESLQIAQGPLSENINSAQSPLLLNVTPQAQLEETTHKVRRGDTLGSIFEKLDYSPAFAHHISKHPIAKQLVSLAIGKQLAFRTNEKSQLKQLVYPLTALHELIVDFEDTSIGDASIVELPYQVQQKSVSGEITSSLYEAAKEAGLSTNLVMEMVRIFGWDVDFVLDIREGDSFHVIYEQFQQDGQKLADGNILAAEFTTQNRTHRAIRFDDGQGNASHYTPEGESMLGTFLRSPVEFSRISSRFGRRKHPILKTWRAHKGVDYAASRGTPIRATADGKIVSAGTKGGYGKAVVLRHAGRFTTLYGHMNGFAKGIRSGGRVKQGDVIGYIGSTGLATGPHLHYEFRLDGVHRNPLTFKTPKAGSINVAFKSEFAQQKNQWLAQLNGISSKYLLAKARSASLSSQVL
jgi:murein DD-endopeptidase MepM/ murein hydrolase activator NlpD